jgi:hypothetical protein
MGYARYVQMSVEFHMSARGDESALLERREGSTEESIDL